MDTFFIATEVDNSDHKNKIYAGDWCFFSKIKEIKKNEDKIISFKILSDKKKIDLEVENLKNFFLKKLINKLNNLHNTNYSDKFWKFLLDPWLLYFLDSYTLKWKIINEVDKSYNKILFNDYINLEPNNFFDVRDYLTKFQSNDQFHQTQFQNILKFKLKKNKKFISFKNKKIFKKDIVFGRKNFFKNSFFKLIDYILSCFSKNNKYFFYKSSLGSKNFFYLNFKLRQFPYFNYSDFEKEKYIKYFDNSINKEVRENLKISIGTKDDFKNFLSEFLIQELPTCYVENFKKLIYESSKISIEPKIIIDSVQILHNSLFKFWAAFKQETSKAIIIYPDHGGTLGIINHNDLLEYLDYRFSWHKPVVKNDIQTPSINLSKISGSRVNSKKDLDKILYISYNNKKYYHFFINEPHGMKNLKITNKFKNLKENLSKEIKEKLYVKTYTRDDKDYWIKNNLFEHDQNKIILSKNTYNNIFKTSKIIICNYPKTSLCEAIVSGPTILLFDFDEWTHSKNFLELKKDLIKNNILFDDANLAANHINSIWDNPLDWWNSDKLLNVRKKFMNQFAMTSSKPINKWEKELEKIYKVHFDRN